MIEKFLKKNYVIKNGIYTKDFHLGKQNKEFLMRKTVASKVYKNYLKEISKFHSIEVMDREIIKFTRNLKKNSLIMDLGCGWCWHWRNIHKIRPDINIVAIDFVRENFYHAKKIISKKSIKQFYFINDNIYNTHFKKKMFDAVWTVQVFQHIPDLSKTLNEVYRILKPGGQLFNYHLNSSIFVKIKNLFLNNKNIKNYYYLNRDLTFNKKLFTKVFKNKILIEYNEIIFHPELKFFLGNKNSFLAKIDSLMSGSGFLRSFLARQVLMKINK